MKYLIMFGYCSSRCFAKQLRKDDFMQSIFEELYHGRINAWERRPIRTAENIAVNRKIEDEKRYFLQKMTLDDVGRFEALENLYSQSSDFEQEGAFSYGFKLGAKLMCAVFADRNKLTPDE